MNSTKRYFAKYTIPDFQGCPLLGTLNVRRTTPLIPQIVRQKVAKTYAKQGITPEQVKVKSIEVTS